MVTNLIPPFAAAGAFLSLVLIGYVLIRQAEERSESREVMRTLEGYDIDITKEESLAPVKERLITPVVNYLSNTARKFTPVGYVETTKHKLVVAGQPGPQALDRFLALRVLSLGIIPLSIFGLRPVLLGGMYLLGVGIMCGVAVLGPEAVLSRRMQSRQHEIRVKLPDVLDLLTISVEAGLGFEQAVDRVVAAVPGELSNEFQRAMGEMRAGSSRAEALRSLDERTDVPEVKSFVLAIVQADTFGVSIGRILRAQADEMRIKRRQLAQGEAQKAPVKMLIPMVFCVFPALFVVVLGPAALSIVENFK